MKKSAQLLKLAKLRQSRAYDGYRNLSDYNDAAYECDYVSPYTKSVHNVDADVMIILQDWCSEDGFGDDVCPETLALGYAPKVRTNINLKNLLRAHLGLSLEDTYATNLFPYIKPGLMDAYIPASDMLRAAREFTLPIIDIVRPSVAVCFGKATFNAVRKACGLKVVYNMDEGISSYFGHDATRIFCQAHPSQQAQNKRNQGGIDRVSADWTAMSSYVNRSFQRN